MFSFYNNENKPRFACFMKYIQHREIRGKYGLTPYTVMSYIPRVTPFTGVWIETGRGM